ncbi:hypothetical protein GY45DRAFT_1332340 [Cubamyces sp. BRFM 1775]|nr:hypothetical protein GY45DRAFT_1332340 [Cubamyces sp. BRFM 1775]
MIADKTPLPGDIDANSEPEDAPPSYSASVVVPVPPSLPRDQKAGSSNLSNTQSSTQNASSSSSALPPKSATTGPSQDTSEQYYSFTSWFNFYTSKRPTKEVRATIAGLLRDLVKQTDAQSALGVLESCADACRAHGVPFSALLQERSIEGHSPLYWSVVSRSPSPGTSSSAQTSRSTSRGSSEQEQERDALVVALLEHAAPLSDTAVDEVRHACLRACDHRFFQRLRRLPAFVPLSVADEIVLGGTTPVDEVEVEGVPGDEAGFVVRFRIPSFQRRMRVAQGVVLEFIAKGRIWSLRFIEATRSNLPLGYRHLRIGSWVVILSLLPHSPPTWIDSRLVIEDSHIRTSQLPQAPSPSSSSSSSPPSSSSSSSSSPTPPPVHTPRPNIELRMKRHEQLVASSSPRSTPHRVIAASLDEDAHGPSLQLDGCPYIENDGALLARLEARLAQPESECTIC